MTAIAGQAILALSLLVLAVPAAAQVAPFEQPAPAETAAPAEEFAPAEMPAAEVAVVPAMGKLNYALADPDRDWLNYTVAIPAVAAVNVLYWTPSKLAGNAFSQIDLSTMKANLSHVPVFDEDSFSTNQFGHPYQGNNYFNAARSAGLSFWEAAPYTAGGSLMWEYFMESGPACCYPSINDFVTTTVGGISLGEMLWRLSNHFLDDSTSGSERGMREFFAFALNPPFGLYRLMSGESWGVGPAPDRHPLSAEASLGVNLLSFSSDATNVAMALRLDVEYGEIVELDDDFEPFDYFTLYFALVMSDRRPAGGRIDMVGLTNGWKFDIFGGSSNAVIGTAFDFAFMSSRIFEIGTSGFGLALFTQTPVAHGLEVRTKMIAVPLFGAITSDYPDIREYNLGPGTGLRIEGELQHERWGKLYASVRRYWLLSTSGKSGEEHAGFIEAGGTVQVTRSLGIGGRFYFIDKEGTYDDFANTSTNTPAGEVKISWIF